MPQFNLRKQIVFIVIGFSLWLSALELFSSAFLFRYYSAIEQPFLPKGTASLYLIRKAFGIPVFDAVTFIEPQPLYTDELRLGYTTLPGRYRAGFSVDGKTHYFNVTVPRKGVRATSYANHIGGKSIYIFGDSFIFGWGNDDEHTMPWLLQQKFPHLNVINLAQNGYGGAQSVIQYEMLKEHLNDDDILVLTYGDYFLVRNYGAPSYMRILSKGIKGRLAGPEGFANARWPAAHVGATGELKIDYINIFCGNNNGYCERADPGRDVMAAGTNALLRFFSKVKQKVILAYISGSDDDPVITYARHIGMTIADIRLNKQLPEWDDFGVYDGHPGPIAQYNYFQKLTSALIDNKIITQSDK